MGYMHTRANRNREAARSMTEDTHRQIQEARDSGLCTPAELAELDALEAQLDRRAESVYGHVQNGDDLGRLMRTQEETDAYLAELGLDERAEAAAGTGSGAADGASGAGSADAKGDPGSIADNLSDGSSLLRLYESDPDEFARQWRELSSEDRTLAMHSLQSAANLEAQITTLFTNIMQAQHQAIMAIARNLSA